MVDVTHERWSPVARFPNYEVSDLARVWSIPRNHKLGRLLKPWLNDNGYFCVTLYGDGTVKKVPVHQLVAEAFLGPCPEGMEVLHGPNGKSDNRAVHLHYGTHLENVRDMVRDGTLRAGDTHQQAKLTVAIVGECRRRNAAHESAEVLALEFGVTGATMVAAVSGETWKDCAVATVIGPRCGERHQDAKLTDEIVRECRARHAAGETKRVLSREFGVSWPAMHAAIIGKTWKHVVA